MAPPYLSVVKSRYSYFVPEVQARLKAVSIILYWERRYIKRPAVSIEVSAKFEELLLDERHDRKPRRPARKYETRNVDLSEDILGCPSCWKQGAGELAPIGTGCFHFNLQQFYPFTPKKVNFKFLLQPHQKYHIRWYANSSLRWKMIILIPILTTWVTYTFLLKGWENVTLDLGNERLI